MNNRTTRCLIIFAAIITVGGYLYVAIPTCTPIQAWCDELHTVIVTGTATSPYRYRILAPLLVQITTPNAIPVGYALLHLLMFAILYPALYSWYKRWMNDDRALLSIFVTIACFWLGFHFYYLSSYSTMEVMLIALALVSLDKPEWIYAVLIGLASLNRETTGLILIALFVLYHKDSLYSVLLAVGWLLITVTLHLQLGNAPEYMSLADTFKNNLQHIPESALANLFLVPLWYLVAVNYRHSTPYLKRLAWIACGYTCILLVSAMWLEFPRLLLSIVPLVLPMALGSGRVVVSYKVQANSQWLDPKRVQKMVASEIERVISER